MVQDKEISYLAKFLLQGWHLRHKICFFSLCLKDPYRILAYEPTPKTVSDSFLLHFPVGFKTLFHHMLFKNLKYYLLVISAISYKTIEDE